MDFCGNRACALRKSLTASWLSSWQRQAQSWQLCVSGALASARSEESESHHGLSQRGVGGASGSPPFGGLMKVMPSLSCMAQVPVQNRCLVPHENHQGWTSVPVWRTGCGNFGNSWVCRVIILHFRSHFWIWECVFVSIFWILMKGWEGKCRRRVNSRENSKIGKLGPHGLAVSSECWNHRWDYFFLRSVRGGANSWPHLLTALGLCSLEK